jgi:aminoglycoside/choline kinase family phosphotransferase
VRGIAACADELSADWLSAVLRAKVRSVSVEKIGAGQTSATYRLAIDADGIPPRLVAKLAQGDEAARQRVVTAHRSEVGFYTSLADRLEVRTPTCWYSAISDDGSAFTLLLEDLAPRSPGRQVAGCTPEQVGLALAPLAALHASSWRDASLRDLDFLIPLTQDRAAFLGGLVATATEQFVRRFGARLEPEELSILEGVAAVIVEWQLGRPETFALVHGDYRVDNLLFSPTDADVVPIDWQTLSLALPARDLAYLLETSLSPDQRRSFEEGLVASYHADLLTKGVSHYTQEQCWEDYRFGMLHGPMITVLGVMTSARVLEPAAEEMFLSMARRSCAAIRDLGSLNVI